MNSSLAARSGHLLKTFFSLNLLEDLCMGCERVRVFDPSSTLYCFLFQVLNCASAKLALIQLNVNRKKQGLKSISLNTAAYVKAKMRLQELRLKTLACATGRKIEEQGSRWFFKGREVYLGDGTVLSMEETDKIKEQYPLTFSQGRQLGQPKMRLFALFTAGTGVFIDGELGCYLGKGNGEPNLLRRMLGRIGRGSILVLDRFFASYYLQCDLRKAGIDYVIRSKDSPARKVLGRKKDRVVVVRQTRNRAERREEEDLPELRVRYIESEIKRPGYRTARIFMLTNLLEEDGYSKEDIEKLYLKRWLIELDFRHLKHSLGGWPLRSKCPEGARKEVWVHLLAFNLIRTINNESALRNGLTPREQGFKVAIQAYLLCLATGELSFMYELLDREILKSVYRREPRAKKKRDNRYPYLTRTREESREEQWGYTRRDKSRRPKRNTLS